MSNVRITSRKLINCKGVLSHGDAEIRITTFNSGSAHINISVSGVEVRLAISLSDLLKLGDAARQSAEDGSWGGFSVEQVLA